jgi:3'-5' exoribonuclease
MSTFDKLWDIIFNDPKFQTWSGSGHPHHHHYGDGGLMQHTMEVCSYSESNAEIAKTNGHIINEDVLMLACVYHDIGKTYDYVKIDGVWQKSPHCRNIHHISRSALIWSKSFNSIGSTDETLHDKVLHCILSHHGRREYGSPVAPKSREAWILHLSDNLSARMFDADTNDMIK